MPAEEKPISLLIVQSDRFLGELLVEKIKAEGMNATVVTSGSEGVQQATQNPPSLIVLGSPLSEDLDVFAVLLRLRADKNTENVPILVLSSIESEDEMKKALKAGADEYLVKSFSHIDEITSKVKTLLRLTSEGGRRARTRRGTKAIPNAPVDAEAEEKDIEELSKHYFEAASKLRAKIEKGLVASGPLSIIDLVNNVLEYAFLMRTSDIHVEPFDDKLVIRLRIDGVLADAFVLPKTIQSEVVTRIKVLAGLRTDEHQMAQDGRFKIQVRDFGSIDVRVSIAPTYFGENSVMRLLAEHSQELTLEALGFSESDLKRITKAIKKPYGMILATGPTGSGKTSTLYAILKRLNTKEVSIITIEDPIEYSLQGVDQIQVNDRTGLTFAHGLRFILRQDPNIIMVGEIRDDETAAIAINAALTGHLLLSTLHSNDAATALPRLIDMKVEPFLIGSTINIVIGQRLVRTICTTCKVPKTLTDAEFDNLKEFIPADVLKTNRSFFMGKGCSECGESGFRGRIGIHEILEMTEEIRQLVIARASASEIKKMAVKNGMVPMLEDGFRKALEGVTTIEEVLRVFHE